MEMMYKNYKVLVKMVYNIEQFICQFCKGMFNDSLSHRIHQYTCDPNPDPFVLAWRSRSPGPGFYNDDPYY
jgi:hypothetical protein